MFEIQLKAWPIDIVTYRLSHWVFYIVQKPWNWAHILVQKPQCAGGGGGGGRYRSKWYPHEKVEMDVWTKASGF